MVTDNNHLEQAGFKREEIDSLQGSNYLRGSGEPFISHTPLTMAVDPRPFEQLPTLFRPFPPSSLSGVPFAYILDQLHDLASDFWGKPETSDCTIVIPVPHPQFRSPTLSARPSYDPSALLPRITLKLHSDYLSANSSFLRSLFSGSSPLDLINTSSMHPTPNSPLRTPSGRFTIPSNRLPRLLNSSPTHPHIDRALHTGTIHWEGIARNVEYLGLIDPIKVFLGDCDTPSLQSDCESNSDSELASSLGDIDVDECRRLSIKDGIIDEAHTRGRDRAIKGISWNSQYAEKFPDASMAPATIMRQDSPVPPHYIAPVAE
ncbi:hypothetical protein BDP27DRAFT_1327434 [Rhodocollybia butyracea]|uniref:Uncharacterized protein n=1 Tax=Rhodocollybia butyracea TaxID=206335 RepID=A0A9P5U6T0_9AGAR|nr:hypothetical protein BDP27DRAFT_1327434 [Rhodocollybia butyracea]